MSASNLDKRQWPKNQVFYFLLAFALGCGLVASIPPSKNNKKNEVILKQVMGDALDGVSVLASEKVAGGIDPVYSYILLHPESQDSKNFCNSLGLPEIGALDRNQILDDLNLYFEYPHIIKSPSAEVYHGMLHSDKSALVTLCPYGNITFVVISQ